MSEEMELEFRAWSLITSRMYHDIQYGIEYCDSLRPFAYVLDRAEPEKNAKFVVMQYSGMRDKNGKKIFKGDICKAYSIDFKEEVLTVGFSNGSFVFEEHGWAISDWKTCYIEVIGNIYQNPELLK